jgi:hypothetical protein
MRACLGFAARAVTSAGVACLAGATISSAQAWLPPRGEAAVTLYYNRLWATEHINYLGLPNSPGDMIWNNIGLDLSYSVNDRLAVRLGLPFVISKYDGAFPHPPLGGVVPNDDGNWHGTFQDASSELRFKATQGSLAVTPFVGIAVPTHDYPTYGHGSPGRGLIEGRFGLAVGRVLDPLLPDLYIQARYTYVVPEKVIGISHNASQLGVDLGYLIGSALTVRAIGMWQWTYGGWRSTVDFPPKTSIDYLHHDQLQRTQYFRLGGSVAYSITSAIDVNVFGYSTVTARSDVDMKSLGIALTYSASPAQLIRRKRKSEAGK